MTGEPRLTFGDMGTNGLPAELWPRVCWIELATEPDHHWWDEVEAAGGGIITDAAGAVVDYLITDWWFRRVEEQRGRSAVLAAAVAEREELLSELSRPPRELYLSRLQPPAPRCRGAR